MTKQLTGDQFLRNLRDSGLLAQQDMDAVLRAQPGTPDADGEAVAQRLITAGKLTAFQAAAVRERRFDELAIGNYQVLDRLGAGGMGTVYKARHRRMKRVVAIKVLSRKIADEKFVQRFQREVEAVARLSHPNIVLAHDADEAALGHFLVMEFVNGRDLASTVADAGPLPVAEAVACTVQAARALDYAHTQAIIHRDIKPANLLRDVNGVVKVADLGLARFNDTLGTTQDESSALTQAGTIMGTVDFMPPEQAMGLANTDHRADIYSLGCTLYFLIVGKAPYHGSSVMAILLKHRDGAIPSLSAARPEAPAALDAVFQRMVAKKPEDRFASMAEVVRALEAVALVPEPQPLNPGATAVFVAMDRDTDVPPATALLVEPSRTQAVIIRGYLQKLGFADVSTAPSGQKALEIARAAPPQVVISAMHLPDMTGVQLAQAMRAEKPLSATGFILITAPADAQEVSLLCEAGNVVRLVKPFDQDQLGRALTAAASPAPAPASEPTPATADRLSRLRVLLVDDSAAARVHIRGVLTGLGVRQIVEAGDGAAAVALLQKQTFDVVVTDYTMPRLDGRGLIDFIRHQSTTPSMPVIVVTTETDPVKLDSVRRLGVSAICDKRFNPEAVRAVLDSLG